MWATPTLWFVLSPAFGRDVAADLVSDKPGTRASAVRAIDKLPPERLAVTEADTPMLEKALADPDPTIRAAAARLIGKAGLRGEWTSVAARLADPDAGVRAAATAVLNDSWPESREPVFAGLHGAVPETKRASLVFLATRPPDPILVREALPALADADDGVRNAARDLLSAAGSLATWEAVAELGDAPLEPALVRFLADRDVSEDPASFERWKAPGQLAELADVVGEVDSPELALKLADNANPAIQQAAVASLVRELDRSVADPKVPLNLKVFTALGDRGQLRSPEVARALGATSFGVWEEAVKRAPSVGDAGLVPVLVASAPAHPEKTAMVLDAVTALDPVWPSRLADPESAAMLSTMLEVSGRMPPVVECGWCQAWMNLDKWKKMGAEAAKNGNKALAATASGEIEAAQDALQKFTSDEAHQGGKLMWARDHVLTELEADRAKLKEPAAAAMGAAIVDRARSTGRAAK